MKHILALDTATQTGWALQADHLVDKVMHDTLDLKKYANMKKYHTGRRHLEFQEFLTGILERDKIDLVIKEQGFFATSQAKAAKLLYGFHAVTEMVCCRFEVEVVDLHSATLKKYTTGDGRASKEDMIDAMIKIGYDPKTDHEADALALLTYAQKEIMND